jgi:hypothetical protein
MRLLVYASIENAGRQVFGAPEERGFRSMMVPGQNPEMERRR